MKTVYNVYDYKSSRPTVVALGIFDGLHKGHKAVLRRLKRVAGDSRAESCVVTFDPHPARILSSKNPPPMLVSTQHKLRLLAYAGIDKTVVIRFTKVFSKMTARRFIVDILVKRLRVKTLVIGKNFLFGAKKSGTIRHMKRWGKEYGFTVETVRPVLSKGEIVSSTRIRNLIMAGNLTEARRLLGRDISILGTVKKGSRRGRILGFPTANLDLHHEAIPPSGVYIVKVFVDSRVYRGILNIGFRPTFNATEKPHEASVEVHIFGFNREIYGKDVEVVFLKKIRRERRYKSRDHLRLRIAQDIRIAKRYFKRQKL